MSQLSSQSDLLNSDSQLSKRPTPIYPSTFGPESIPIITQTFLQCLIVSKTLAYSRAAQIYAQIITTYLRKTYHATSSEIPDPLYPGAPISQETFPDLQLPEHIRKPCSAPENEKIYLPRLLETLNSQVRALDLSVKTLRDQISGIRIICFVNLRMSPGTIMATSLSSAEVEWFKTLLDVIFTETGPTTDAFAVNGNHLHAAYPTSATNKETITRDMAIQKAMKMVDLGWFIEVQYDEKLIHPLLSNSDRRRISTNNNQTIGRQNKTYNDQQDEDDQDDIPHTTRDNRKSMSTSSSVRWFTLSTRSLAELERYLNDKFGKNSDTGPDGLGTIKYCAACKQIWTLGYKCIAATGYAQTPATYLHHSCRERLGSANLISCLGTDPENVDFVSVGL